MRLKTNSVTRSIFTSCVACSTMVLLAACGNSNSNGAPAQDQSAHPNNQSTLDIESAAHASPQTAQAQYIANAGILVSQGDTKVLFDPFFNNGFDTYSVPSSEQVNAIMQGIAPYNGINAVFISHAHGDHFSASQIIAYMKAHKAVRIVAPQQALEMMQDEVTWEENLLRRVMALDLAYEDGTISIGIGAISSSAVRIPHSGWPDPRRAAIQNLVYRVTLNETATVMHMGDADPRAQHYTPYKAHWAVRSTDTAFPPYWFYGSDEGQAILADIINVKNSIGVHVPIKIPQGLKDSGADYFSKAGETRPVK